MASVTDDTRVDRRICLTACDVKHAVKRTNSRRAAQFDLCHEVGPLARLGGGSMMMMVKRDV